MGELVLKFEYVASYKTPQGDSDQKNLELYSWTGEWRI